jgi:hypothetical protein
MQELEGKVRRAKIMLSDRELIIQESKLLMSKLCKQEVLHQHRIFEKEASLSCIENSTELMTSLLEDKAKLAKLVVTHNLFDQTGTHSSSVISSCKHTISSTKTRLDESVGCCSEVFSRVLSLESLLHSMREQKARMSVGGGNLFFRGQSQIIQ